MDTTGQRTQDKTPNNKKQQYFHFTSPPATVCLHTTQVCPAHEEVVRTLLVLSAAASVLAAELLVHVIEPPNEELIVNPLKLPRPKAALNAIHAVY